MVPGARIVPIFYVCERNRAGSRAHVRTRQEIPRSVDAGGGEWPHDITDDEVAWIPRCVSAGHKGAPAHLPHDARLATCLASRFRLQVDPSGDCSTEVDHIIGACVAEPRVPQ